MTSITVACGCGNIKDIDVAVQIVVRDRILKPYPEV